MKKGKIILSIFMALALVLTGTLAWVNFQQQVINDFAGEPGKPPGGTTHDDFDEPTKDVYIENWGTRNLYVRIRLDEYMEIGTGAGKKGHVVNGVMVPDPDNKAVSLMSGAKINDPKTWSPHIPYRGEVEVCNTPADFHGKWEWKMGGWKYFMPAPESTHANNAYVDQNTTRYNGTEPGVRKTLDAEVITMAAWKNMGKPIGPYWVIDVDGWAYWAAPLEPDTATGLLLHAVNKIFEHEDSYYYAINVVVQMATKFGDLNYTNLYDETDDNRKATNDGKDLLDIITKDETQGRTKVPATSVRILGGDRELEIGEVYTPGCEIKPDNSTDKAIWGSSNAAVARVDSNGKITAVSVGTAEISVSAGDVHDSVKIKVVTSDVPATSVTIEGGDRNMVVGDSDTLRCEIKPPNSTSMPHWSSSAEGVVTVNPVTGQIQAVGAGTADITVTAGGVQNSIKITVSAAQDPLLPLLAGEGPYDTRYNDEEEDLNYALIIKLLSSNFGNDETLQNTIRQTGSIKLSEILSGDDYSGLGVKAANASQSKYFSIGTDKDGKPALIYTYIPAKSVWDAALQLNPPVPPVETVSLMLTKANYRDTPIKITVRYNGSTYIDK